MRTKKILLAILFLALVGVLVVFIFRKQTQKQDLVYTSTKQEQIVENENKIENKPILFLGDIMVGRDVETSIDKKGFDYMFSSATRMFSDTFTVANLEGPIPEKHVHTSNLGFQFSFRSDIIQKLGTLGLDAVSLANNHGYDHGVAGYENSKKVLNEVGIAYTGNFDNTNKDVIVAKLGGHDVIIYGVNVINYDFDENVIIENIKELDKKFVDAGIVIYIHWGNEYDKVHNKFQEDLAHKMIDAGVDLVIGAHPHVVQDVGYYHGVPIYYSLGNFVFDQYFSTSTQQGLGVIMDIDNSGHVIYKTVETRSLRGRPSFVE